MDQSFVRTFIAGLLAALCAMLAAVAASAARGPEENRACSAADQGGPGVEAMPEGTAERSLVAHNAERARLRLPPLAWSCRLEADAARWARVLAARGALEHANAETRGDSGENLWMGTAGHWPVEQMVGRFIEEKRHYRHGRFPDISRTGNWADVAHYTQIVWRDTREVGCALAEGARHDVLVCRYSPAGNVQGSAVY